MDNWNPWHGCVKYSPGCRNCHVFNTDNRYGCDFGNVYKTSSYDLPIRLNKDKQYKLTSPVVATCFTSDFFIDKADKLRTRCWEMIKTRSELYFLILTKRVIRIKECLPDDWQNGYDNVIICASVENQHQADLRLPVFNELPIKHKMITLSPLLEYVDISKYLNSSIEQVSVSGESGKNARLCRYEWILDIRNQCIDKDIPFHFMQTGSLFEKDGRTYNIKKAHQYIQAKKARIDYKYDFTRGEFNG